MSYTMMRQKIFTVADCVRVAAELGMDGIDWVTTYGEDPKLLKKMSDDAGLPVAAHTFFIRNKDSADFIGTVERSLDDACILGAPVVMVVPNAFPEVTDPAENRRRWCDVLAAAAPLAEARGIAMSVENFPGVSSAFVTAADFHEAKAAVPSLKLTYDGGNAATGEDPVESLKSYIGDVVHVHFKDWKFSDTQGNMKMTNGKFGTPALIGEGDVDNRAILRTLEEADYKGYINIEYENNDYRADEAVKRALAYLKGGR